MESMRSSTLGRSASKYIRPVEIPSSNSPARARSNPLAFLVRKRTARAEAMPYASLYCLPSASVSRFPVLSYVPANQDPIMTLPAPAASANATSRGYRTPPSAQIDLPAERAASAHSSTARSEEHTSELQS